MSLQKLKDYRIGYLILFVIILVLALVPVAVPIVPTELTMKGYNHIQSLGPDSKPILLLSGLSGAWYIEYVIAQRAVMTHIIQRGIPVVCMSRDTSSVPNDISELTNEYAIPYGKQNLWESPVYGTKIVYLGYIETAGALTFTLADNFRALTTVDYRGTPFDNLPVMKNIKNVADFSYVIYSNPMERTAPTAIYLPYKVKLMSIESVGGIGWIVDLYSAGLVESIIAGAKGAAEYESLLGIGGQGHRWASIIVGMSVYAVIGIIVANAYYVLQRRKITTGSQPSKITKEAS